MKVRPDQDFEFLRMGGEMGEIIRNMDWESTPLGSPGTWPVALKISLNTILNTSFPMFIWWGRDLLCFYNDAYRPSLGIEGKHPLILGQPAKLAWPEIWSTIGPRIRGVMETGEATWNENQLVPIFRNGKLEDVYWTYSYSAIFGETGNIDGVLVTVAETTQEVLTRKQLEESKNQLRFAIDAAELSTWDYDPQKTTFTANNRLKQWFGLPNESELQLSSAIDSVLEKDKERVLDTILKSLDPSTDGKYDIMYTIKNKANNKERVVRAKGRAWHNEEGKAIRLNGILYDVTLVKEAYESRAKLISIMETSREYITLANTEFQMSYANPAALNMLGWDDMDNKSILDCFYPEDLELGKLLLHKLMETGYISEEIRFVNAKNGNPFWLKWNAFTIKDPNSGQVTGLGTVSPNIEAEIAKERELYLAMDTIRTKDQEFRNMVHNAPVGIATFRSPDFLVEMANITLLDIIEKQEDEFIGLPLFRVLPSLKASLLPMFNKTMETGESTTGREFKIVLDRHHTKTDAYFDFIFHPIKDINKKITGIMLVATEVTDYVVSRNKFEESELQFRNLVMQSPIPMTILEGPDHIIAMANDIILNKLWRRKRRDVLGKKLMEVFPELENQKYPELLKNVLESGKPLFGKESYVQVNGDDGMRNFYVDYDYLPLRELDGTTSGIMITAHDVTDKVLGRKRLEEFSQELEKEVAHRTEMLRETNAKLIKSVEDLEKANNDLQSFAYISSHDLQEPLRKIQIFTSRIMERDNGFLTDKNKTDFERVLVSATRMRTLIDDLLSFSQTKEITEGFEAVDLNYIVQEVETELQELLLAADAKIIVGELPKVMGIPFQLTQLIQNLLENALKFSKKEIAPMVNIDSEAVSKDQIKKLNLDPTQVYCKISITDNGIGFNDVYKKRIFEVFQRLHNKSEYQGTGIGLAIVNKIVLNHNGAVTAKSKLGQGATFSLFLPKA